jgi:hypothetical protein
MVFETDCINRVTLSICSVIDYKGKLVAPTIHIVALTNDELTCKLEDWICWCKLFFSYEFSFQHGCFDGVDCKTIKDFFDGVDGIYNFSEISVTNFNLFFGVSLGDYKYMVEIYNSYGDYLINIRINGGLIFSDTTKLLSVSAILDSLFSTRQVREAKLKLLI